MSVNEKAAPKDGFYNTGNMYSAYRLSTKSW